MIDYLNLRLIYFPAGLRGAGACEKVSGQKI